MHGAAQSAEPKSGTTTPTGGGLIERQVRPLSVVWAMAVHRPDLSVRPSADTARPNLSVSKPTNPTVPVTSAISVQPRPPSVLRSSPLPATTRTVPGSPVSRVASAGTGSPATKWAPPSPEVATNFDPSVAAQSTLA